MTTAFPDSPGLAIRVKWCIDGSEIGLITRNKAKTKKPERIGERAAKKGPRLIKPLSLASGQYFPPGPLARFSKMLAIRLCPASRCNACERLPDCSPSISPFLLRHLSKNDASRRCAGEHRRATASSLRPL